MLQTLDQYWSTLVILLFSLSWDELICSWLWLFSLILSVAFFQRLAQIPRSARAPPRKQREAVQELERAGRQKPEVVGSGPGQAEEGGEKAARQGPFAAQASAVVDVDDRVDDGAEERRARQAPTRRQRQAVRKKFGQVRRGSRKSRQSRNSKGCCTDRSETRYFRRRDFSWAESDSRRSCRRTFRDFEREVWRSFDGCGSSE